MKSRITKLAAVAAVFAVTATIPVQLMADTQFYSKVIAAIQKAQTITFTQVTQDKQSNGEVVKTDFAYKEPGRLRTSTPDGYITIVDGKIGKMITIMPHGNYTLADMNTTINNPVESMKRLPDKPDGELAAIKIDDIDCHGYMAKQGDLTTNIWVDANTGSLVQIEKKYKSAAGMNMIIKNIKLDVKLDDSLFIMKPPEGSRTDNLDIKGDSSKMTEETFINFLRWWANGTYDGTFPPTVQGPQIAKVSTEMTMQGKFKNIWKESDGQLMFNALLFIAKLPKDSDWRYAGNGVRIDTRNKPIFWYKPADSEKYRVIYADLKVKELPANKLPK